MIDTYREVLKLSPCQPEIVSEEIYKQSLLVVKRFTSRARLNANRPGVYVRPPEWNDAALLRWRICLFDLFVMQNNSV